MDVFKARIENMLILQAFRFQGRLLFLREEQRNDEFFYTLKNSKLFHQLEQFIFSDGMFSQIDD